MPAILYPATLSQLKIYFAAGNSNLSPGAAITLLVGSNPDGDENINGTSFQQVGATIQSLNQFNVYNVPSITINSGDFVVGFGMQIPANVYPGALDTPPPSRRRSYLSTDGVNFDLTENRSDVPDGNWGIRAIVNSQPPILSLTPTSLTFNTVVGQSSPSQQFTVNNVGSGTLTYSISNSDSSLVSVSPTSGTLQAGQSNTITVVVTPPTQPGTRQAFLTINAPGAQNSPQTVTVTVNTTSPPAILDVSPTSLTFTEVVGQSNPPPQQIIVRNIGSGSLTFNITSSHSGLVSVSPASGTLVGGQSQAVTVFVNNLNQVGTRQATLTVSAPGAQNSPQTVSVTIITTGQPPILSLSPTSLTFNAFVGQGNPPPQPITVQNTGGSSLSFTITSNSGSVSVSPASGTLAPGQSQPIQVSVINPNSPGTINAQLTVTASGAQNSPQVVNVTINTQGSSGQPENEPNNSPSAAAFLNLPAPGQSITISGDALPTDAGTTVNQLTSECQRDGLIQDWFRLVVNQRDSFRAALNFQSADADFDLWLFNQSNDFAHFPQGVQLMAFSAQGPAQPETVGPRVLEPGTYFIGVSRPRQSLISDLQRVGYTLAVTRGLSPELHAIEDAACVGFIVNDPSTNGYFVVNRVRPTRYPARLESISALFSAPQGQPSPNGRPVRIIAFTDPSGSGAPPFNPPLVVNQTVTVTVPSGGGGQFNRLNLGAGGPVISQGDFYVGYVVDVPNGIFINAGRVLDPNIRSLVSTNGGQTYQQLNIQDGNGQLFNVAIRAAVNTRPFNNVMPSAKDANEVRDHEVIEMIEPQAVSIDIR
jgi:hypothetical protein